MGRLLTTFKDKTFEPSMKSYYQLYTDDTSTAAQIYDSLLYVRGINAGSLAKNQEGDDDVSTVETYDTYMPIRFYNVKSASDGSTPAGSTHTFFNVYNRAEYNGPDGQNMYDLWADYNLSKLSGAGYITNTIGGAYNYGYDAGSGDDQTIAGIYGALNYARIQPTGDNRTVTYAQGARNWIQVNKTNATVTFAYSTTSEFNLTDGNVGTLALHKFDLDYTAGNITNAYFIWADESSLPTPSGEKYFIKSNIGWPTLLSGALTNTGAVTFNSTLAVTGTATFNSDVSLQDNDKLKIGTGDDLQIYHDGSNSYIENGSSSSNGNLIIRSKATTRDLIFQGDNGDGSSSSTTYFYLNGSMADIGTGSVYTQFPDYSHLIFGNSSNANSLDLAIYHDGSASYIQNGATNFNIESKNGIYIENKTASDINITNSADDGDIIFYSDNGSGGTAEYFRVDGGTERNIFSKDSQHVDGISAYFGSSNDFRILHNGTHSFLTQNGTGDLRIVTAVADGDIRFQADDGSGSGSVTTYIKVDGGLEKTVSSKHIMWLDNVKAQFGDSNDLEIYHDGADSYIADAGTGDLRIRSNFLKIEKYTGETMATFNDDNAVTLYYNNSAKFETTNTGATLTGNLVMGSGQVKFADSGKVMLGDSNDLQIYHDGSDSFIEDTGTGDLKIKGSNDIFLLDGSNNVMIEASAAGSVDLYHNNNKKFETTSTGTKTTGQMDLAALNTPVTNSDDNGTVGEIRFTSDYIYVCVADDTWKRAALSTW